MNIQSILSMLNIEFVKLGYEKTSETQYIKISAKSDTIELHYASSTENEQSLLLLEASISLYRGNKSVLVRHINPTKNNSQVLIDGRKFDNIEDIWKQIKVNLHL